ncbi:lantibiotic dehydratase [Pedobacter sp. UBA5917]|jgi:thiopeptide-type bacteriocin biosynthesis protein|uniref:lantibiotic dehydratase n=1 Tax=Pedobacter sp. UBA5917 TaxID=1947061 RepID=UPI0025FFE5E0|nr:lantibiotic dehydratase [Pedobacter sp. UBA5917]
MLKENNSYEFIGDLVLRTPYLPNNIDIFSKEYASDDKVMEAIYLASPTLCEQLVQGNKKESEKLWVSLYKYISRMSSRCTPFGLFAGISTIKWGGDTAIEVSENIRRKTRLDMAYLCKLAEDISKNPTVRHSVKYFANNTLYQAGENFRYIELQYSNASRQYQISSAQRTDYLEEILAMAGPGVKLETLAGLLTSDDISLEEAYEYLFELIDNRLLIWELEPKVTNENDYGRTIYHFLSENADLFNDERLKTIHITLGDVLSKLDLLDQQSSNKIESYKEVYHRLTELELPIQEGNLFQVDYTKETSGGILDSAIQLELLEALDVLRFLNYRLKENLLNMFKEKFYAKYEDREIPLQTVLDTDIGLVYGSDSHSDTSPLIDDIAVSGSGSGPKKINWYDENSFLLKALGSCIARNGSEIRLEEEDFEGQLNMISPDEMPDSLAAIFRTIDSPGSRIQLEYFSGSSAVNVLGRFAYLDEKTDQIIRKIISREKELLKPGEVMAEIIHFPEDRIGNIILRPSFLDHEIPYLTHAGVASEKTIRIEDLVLSMRGGKFVLRSVKDGRIVKPRLSNAHNFSNKSLPVYRFLCDLQAQDRVGGISFEWANFFTSQFDFLPRVSHKSVILSPAMWMLRSNDLAPLKQNGGNHEALSRLCSSRKLPERFIISEGDNELLIDFSQRICIATFFDYIKRRDNVVIKECFLGGSNTLVTDNNGHPFNSQFIAPIVKKASIVQETDEIPEIGHNLVMNDYQPGDAWLYYKIYCGSQSADKILTENLPQLNQRLYSRGLIEKTFFIRFSDPEWHLRIRFRLKDASVVGDVIMAVKEAFEEKIRSGVISKIQIDTYKPEFKRYGSNTIEWSESLFDADSRLVTSILNTLDDYHDPEELRWLIAMSAVDALLDDFGYGLDDKIRIMGNISQSFNREFGFNKALKVQMDSKYRKHRNQIAGVMETRPEHMLNLHEIVQSRSEKIRPIAEHILQLESEGNLMVAKDDLLASYIHMHINRLMKSRQRLNELLLYYFLDKYYTSINAMQRKSLKIA